MNVGDRCFNMLLFTEQIRSLYVFWRNMACDLCATLPHIRQNGQPQCNPHIRIGRPHTRPKSVYAPCQPLHNDRHLPRWGPQPSKCHCPTGKPHRATMLRMAHTSARNRAMPKYVARSIPSDAVPGLPGGSRTPHLRFTTLRGTGMSQPVAPMGVNSCYASNAGPIVAR